MKTRRIYFLLTLAVVSLVGAAVMLAIYLGESEDASSATTLSTSGDGEKETITPTFTPFITPNATLSTLSPKPTGNPAESPSQRPTIEISFSMEPSKIFSSMSPAPSSENATDWPSLSPTNEVNETLTSPAPTVAMIPSVSPVSVASNDDPSTTEPTALAVPLPSVSPTATPATSLPTPSFSTSDPTDNPTAAIATKHPTSSPTQRPTLAPIVSSDSPSKTPSRAPVTSNVVSIEPTNIPSMSPTVEPSFEGINGRLATFAPTNKTQVDDDEGTRFYAIGDVPYSDKEAKQLKTQIVDLPLDAEFLIHVGDIRSARDGRTCEIEEYHEVAAILNQSHAPVFLVLGDNEWNDCPNINQGFDHWMAVFGKFDEQWDHSFLVKRHETRPENFWFVHKRTLFIGLNIVGGLLHHGQEWKDRLQDLSEWVQELVNARVISSQPVADSVVMFGHANPNGNHAGFFDPLTEYLREDLLANVPFLYLNGDAHKWNYKQSFYGESNLLRMQVEGGVRDPPLQVSLQSNSARTKSATQVFQYDRMLSALEI